MNMILSDFRQGARSLWKAPVLLAVAVISLCLGIGVTSTFYGVFDALVLHDVTARDADRLVSFWTPLNSYPNYPDVRESGVFEEVAAAGPCYPAVRWRDGEQTRDINADCVSANFFQAIGVQAAMGRVFNSQEAAAERNPRMAVVSYSFWEQHQAGPGGLGNVIVLDNTPFTVIGVLPPDYKAIEGGGFRPDIFVPFNTALEPNLMDRSAAVMNLIGRLIPGRSIQQTRQALAVFLKDLQTRTPGQHDALSVPELTPVQGLAKYRQGEENRSFLTFSIVAGALSILVLLIACANVAGLLLSLGVARKHEMAVRMALGATRGRIVRRLLVESSIVCALGTTAGLIFTFVAAILLRKVAMPGNPVRFEFFPDWRFVSVAALLGVIATLVSGLAPSLSSSRAYFGNSALSSRSITPRLRWRSILVIGQIAFSVVLLSGAFIFARDLLHVVRLNPGFDAVDTIWFDLSTDQTAAEQDPTVLHDRLYRNLTAYPGVESVSWAWYLPLNLVYGEPVVRPEDAPDAAALSVTEQGIGPGYLKTMRIPLLAGREFERNDLTRSDKALPQPVIVNEALVHTFFHDQNPIGKRLLGGRNGANNHMEIIGVAANTSFRAIGEKPVPLLQTLSPSSDSFLVRVTGAPASMALELAKMIRRDAPGVDVGYIQVRDRLDRGIWPTRAAAATLGILAVVGLILALIGLSGAFIYNVSRRTPEMGLRMVLGATPWNVVYLMLRDAMLLVLAGAAIGIISTLAVSQIIRKFLAADISPADPLSYFLMLITLLGTSGISILLPSRRLARIDPGISLRAE